MTQIIHFDSVYGQLDSLNDPFSCLYQILNPLQNVNSIWLKSIELPIAFYNIRNSGTLNQFSITINSSIYSITLNSKNYISIGALCEDITTAFSAVSLPNSAVFTLSAGSSNVIATLASTVQTNFVVNNTQLSFYILGFKNQSAQINTGTTTKTSTRNALNNFNLSIDNYLNLTITNQPILNNSNSNGILSSFKIPLNGLVGDVVYLYENQTFRQHVTIGTNNTVIHSLKIVITDRFGNPLLNNGLDYSLSLGFGFYSAVDEFN